MLLKNSVTLFIVICGILNLLFLMIIPSTKNQKSFNEYQGLQITILNQGDSIIANQSHQMQLKNINLKNSCGIFPNSFEENLKIVTDYRFNVSSKYLLDLNLDSDGIETLSHVVVDARIPVIVSAVSSNHFHEIQALIENIHEKLMTNIDIKFILYDIGLSVMQANIIKKYCRCEFRAFPFHRFPDHVRILRGYTWKPIIIQLVLMEYEFIMWVDASIRFHGNKFDSLFTEAYETKIKLLPGGGSIADRTFGFTFNVLGENPCLYQRTEYSASCILIRRTNFTLYAIMRPWISCALQYECMTIDNVERIIDCRGNTLLSDVPLHRCHRFDQSVISIILTRLFHDKRDHLLVTYKEYLSKERRHTSKYMEKLYYSDNILDHVE